MEGGDDPNIPDNRDEEEERFDDCPPRKGPALAACKCVRAFGTIQDMVIEGMKEEGKGCARETSNQRMTDNMPESRIPRSDMVMTPKRTGRQQKNRGRWKMK